MDPPARRARGSKGVIFLDKINLEIVNNNISESKWEKIDPS